MSEENIRIGQIVRLNNPNLFHGNGIYFIGDSVTLGQMKFYSKYVTILFTDKSLKGQWCGSSVVNSLLNWFDIEHGLNNSFPYTDFDKAIEI